MDSWFLHGRSKPGQQVGLKANAWVELDRPYALFGWQECDGNPGNMSFFAAKTRPKGCRNYFFDRARVGFWGIVRILEGRTRGHPTFEPLSHYSCCGIRRSSHIH